MDVKIISCVPPTHAEYVRVRLVGSGLGSSPGCGGFLSLSQTRLPSLRKGKESCRGVRGEVSGSGGSAGEEASGSDILTGYRFFVLFWFRSPPVAHKEEEEGGLHLLHGKSVCEGGEVFREEVLQVEEWSNNTLERWQREKKKYHILKPLCDLQTLFCVEVL